MKDTKPFFVVGSGRCGTLAIARALNMYDDVECQHEYVIQHTQPMAMVSAMRPNAGKTPVIWNNIYESAIYYSEYKLWGECSNKASWAIRPLNELFPDAKFIHIVRDGRKVVSSFYHKLAMECYDPRSVNIMMDWLELKEPIIPPIEKKYWWPLPPNARELDQFSLMCWHWEAINEHILSSFAKLDKSRTRFFQLEDLVSNPKYWQSLTDFLGLPCNDAAFASLKRPHNVTEPIDYRLTKQQTDIFWKFCEPMMKELGYGDRQSAREEYRVDYRRE